MSNHVISVLLQMNDLIRLLSSMLPHGLSHRLEDVVRTFELLDKPIICCTCGFASVFLRIYHLVKFPNLSLVLFALAPHVVYLGSC